MAILALPLVISFLKPHSRRFSLSTLTGGPYRSRFYFSSGPNRSRYVSDTSTSTFANWIKRRSSKSFNPYISTSNSVLQEYWASVGCAVMQCNNTEALENDIGKNSFNYSQSIFSGLWLTKVTTDAYKVPEVPES